MSKKGVIAVKIRTVGYFIKQAGKSIRRNFWMSLAAVLSVAISMFILGAFLLLVYNINYISTNLKSNVEAVVFLPVEAPRETSLEVREKIKGLPEVVEAVLVTKEEGFKVLSKQFGGEEELLDATGGVDFLPDYLRVRVKDPETIHDFAQKVETMPQVEKVNYGQEYIDRLFAVAKLMHWLGSGIVFVLGLGATCLIVITIRLTVYSRWREINIMKFVGATDWFIRWPFLLEGLFLGLMGSGIAALFVYWGYNLLFNELGTTFMFIPLLNDQNLILRSSLILVAVGALVGAFGSLFSIRRFLKV